MSNWMLLRLIKKYDLRLGKKGLYNVQGTEILLCFSRIFGNLDFDSTSTFV